TVPEISEEYFVTNEPTSLIQRFVRQAEVAKTVAFLTSDGASAINGSAQRCEGGLIRHL
ncbi:hypothetical protein KIPB_004448, partial [Kipferlia bialata]